MNDTVFCCFTTSKKSNATMRYSVGSYSGLLLYFLTNNPCIIWKCNKYSYQLDERYPQYLMLEKDFENSVDNP
jgi:hypothetical protein